MLPVSLIPLLVHKRSRRNLLLYSTPHLPSLFSKRPESPCRVEASRSRSPRIQAWSIKIFRRRCRSLHHKRHHSRSNSNSLPCLSRLPSLSPNQSLRLHHLRKRCPGKPRPQLRLPEPGLAATEAVCEPKF